MSLQSPSLSDINDDLIARLEASLGQTVPLLPRTPLRVIAKVLAASLLLLYKYTAWMHEQIYVRTATMDLVDIDGQQRSPLTLWGQLIGVGSPVPATRAELQVSISVTTQGGVLPVGTQFVAGDTRVVYTLTESVALDNTTVYGRIRAVGDNKDTGGVGVQGNRDVGDTLSFANNVTGVSKDVTVSLVYVTAADSESETAYRQRVIDRFQKRPQGGALADYEHWGEEVAGILNIYPYTSGDCPGQVDVYVEATEASSGSPDGIPTTAQLQAVRDSIDLDVTGLATRRPANAAVNTFAIARIQFDVNVSGIDEVADLAQTRQDIEDALDVYFKNREPFVAGLTLPPRRDRVAESAVNGIVEDAVSASGGIYIAADVTRGGSPIDIYTLGIGEKAKLGNVTYVG